MSRERVLLHSDGLRLVGELYLPQGEGPWPGVVVCHGLASRKERHEDFATHAASRGLAVLTFDLRGHGESEGKLDSGLVADVGAAVRYLGTLPRLDAKRLAVRGSSLGGYVAIQAAATMPELRACVAICPAAEHVLADGLRRLALEGGTVPDARVDLTALPGYLLEHRLKAAVARLAPKPLLLIHCLGDQTIPASLTTALYGAACEPKDLWLLAGGSHTSAQHDAMIHERTVAWLQSALTP